MLQIQITSQSFTINQVAFGFPMALKDLILLLGEPREGKGNQKGLHTWDQLGLVSYPSDADDGMVKCLYLNFVLKDYEFFPTTVFQGSLQLEGEESQSYYKQNKQKAVKLFKQDQGGAFVFNGVQVWFNRDQDQIEGIQISPYQEPKAKEIPIPLPLDAGFEYVTLLWADWVAEIKKTISVHNRYFNLTHGITNADLEEIAKYPELEFPLEILNFYKVQNVEYDGVASVFSLWFDGWNYDLLPFARILDAWFLVRELESDLGSESDSVNLPEGAIKNPGYANKMWVPIAEGRNGDYLLFDADPGPNGRYGQIIELQNDTWTRTVAADSLEALIKNEIQEIRKNPLERFNLVLDGEP